MFTSIGFTIGLLSRLSLLYLGQFSLRDGVGFLLSLVATAIFTAVLFFTFSYPEVSFQDSFATYILGPLFLYFLATRFRDRFLKNLTISKPLFTALTALALYTFLFTDFGMDPMLIAAILVTGGGIAFAVLFLVLKLSPTHIRYGLYVTVFLSSNLWLMSQIIVAQWSPSAQWFEFVFLGFMYLPVFMQLSIMMPLIPNQYGHVATVTESYMKKISSMLPHTEPMDIYILMTLLFVIILSLLHYYSHLSFPLLISFSLVATFLMQTLKQHRS